MSVTTLHAVPQTLEDDIFLLEELDRIRERCERWRSEGLAGLEHVARGSRSKKEPQETWGELSLDDRALLVKALCRPGLPQTVGGHFDFLRKVNATDVLMPAFDMPAQPTKKPLFKKGKTHLLDCALALTALSSAPSGVFSPSTMLFYYVVVRELYEAAPPKRSVGGARAGVDGAPSALVTSEFVRGVLSFTRMLQRTGAYIESLADLHINNPVAMREWQTQDSTRRALALSTTLAQRAFNLAFPLRPEDARPARFDDVSIAIFEKHIRTKLVRSLAESVKTFKVALNAVTTFRTNERKAAGDDDRKHFLLDRSESAHAVAARALADALERAESARKLFRSPAKGQKRRPFAKELRELKEAFDSAAVASRALIQPSIDYLGAVLDRELAAASAEPGAGGFEASEMAAAAAGLGAALDNWEDERIERAARHLSAVLSPDGFVVANPYFVGGGSYYQAPQPPIMGAYAQILEHVDRVELSPVVLRRIISYFDTTRREINKTRSSWRWTYAAESQLHSPYHTAISTLALDRICRMLDARINNRVLQHFAYRKPKEIGLHLNQLFYPDYGLAQIPGQDKGSQMSIAVALQRMRAHIAGTTLQEPYAESFYSVVFHGPPGTGKTTLLEALARSADVPLVEVTPSEIVVEGQDRVESRARSVLRALSLLTRVVIVFDEFDPVLRTRETQENMPPSIFAFLTASMLTKLKKLYEAAKKRHIAYALLTNYVRTLDQAAIRTGRFDALIGVYPPDLISRYGRLRNEVEAYRNELKASSPGHPKVSIDIASLNERFERVIAQSAGTAMQQAGKRGWFTRPDVDTPPKGGTIFGYLFSKENSPGIPTIETSQPGNDQLSPEEQRDMAALQSLEVESDTWRAGLWKRVRNAFPDDY